MKKRILIGITVLLLMASAAGCGGVVKTSTKNRCNEVAFGETAFQMPAFFQENAEQIETFEDALSSKETYLKNSKDGYWCFNLDAFLVHVFIVPERVITDLDGYEELFFERGLRLELDSEKSESGTDLKGNPKMILNDVYCEAVLTQELYEDYTGKAALIKRGDEHICAYVGAKRRHVELEREVLRALDDVVYTLTSVKEKLERDIETDKQLINGRGARISVLSDRGEITVADLAEIRVLSRDEASNYQRELKEQAPIGSKWQFVKLSGKEYLKDIKLKVLDMAGMPFDTGSRTYTVLLSGDTRVDAYLIPEGDAAYLLKVGESSAGSLMTIE